MRFLANVAKEVKLGWRSHYFLLSVGLALVYFLLVTFLPTAPSAEVEVFVLYESGDLSALTGEIFGEPSIDDAWIVLESREELEKRMNRSFNSLGVVVGGSANSPAIELIFQGHESEASRELLKLSIIQRTGSTSLRESDYPVQYLKADSAVDTEIPFNKSLAPVFLLFEAVMVGLLFVFAMVFTEKSQKTLAAYSITPGRIWEYLGAKVVLLVMLGFLFTLIFTPLVFGVQAKYFQLLLVVALGSVLSTSVGLIFASFYKNLSQSLVAFISLYIFFGLPILTYFIEGFSPWYLKVIPTYPILFALKNALFPGSSSVSTSGIWLVALESLIAFIVAVRVYSLAAQRD